MIMFTKKFRKQLGRCPGGYYKTNLICKENHPLLQNNESRSLGRLNKLIRNLNRSKSLEVYDKALQGQIRKVNVGRVTESEKSVDTQKGEEVFYLPNSPVILESAESTKVRIVYDAPAKASKSTVPLNVLTLVHLFKIHFMIS